MICSGEWRCASRNSATNSGSILASEAAQQVPDTSLVQFDIELSRDLLPKINDTPANHAVGLEDRAPSYPLGQRRFLLLRELARRTAAVRTVGQAGHAFGIIMMHPVA